MISCLENEAAGREQAVQREIIGQPCDWAGLFPPETNYITLDQQAHLEITATHL